MSAHGGKREGAGRPRKEKQADAVARFNEAKADKERALADLRTMEARQRERTLLEIGEVEEAIGTAFATISHRLLGLPDELERLHDLEPALAESIEGTIHQVMTSLADDLQTLAGDLQP